MRRLTALAVIMTAAMAKPALAFWINRNDGTYTYVPDGLVVFVLALAVVLFVAFVAIVSASSISGPPPRQKSADEYNAEAVLLAAQRHHTEMETELRKAQIEAARVNAMHKETSDIIAHDKKVRHLNAKLDETRRAS